MGNILPLPCAKRRKQQQHKQRPGRSRNIWAARPRHAVVPVVDMLDAPDDGDGGGREQEAWPECRVEPAGHGEDGAVRVRIVMKRKDIAQLVARLEQRGDGEWNTAAGMEEIVSAELAGCNGDGGGGGGGGVPMMSPCRDAWRPRLSIIPENW